MKINMMERKNIRDKNAASASNHPGFQNPDGLYPECWANVKPSRFSKPGRFISGMLGQMSNLPGFQNLEGLQPVC
jgi:hypothetical protein